MHGSRFTCSDVEKGGLASMKSQTKYGLLVGAGILVGSVGLKALTSQAARRVYVQGIAKGLQAKSCYEGIVEQARAQASDIIAEARYANEPASGVSDVAPDTPDEETVACEESEEAQSSALATAKK